MITVQSTFSVVLKREWQPATRVSSISSVVHFVAYPVQKETKILGLMKTVRVTSMERASVLIFCTYINGLGFTYALHGRLLDGTTLEGTYIETSFSGSFNLNNTSVPAPGSLVTALIGVVPGVWLLRQRRKETSPPIRSRFPIST